MAEKCFADEVKDICNGLAEMLIEKNRKYGDAALNPQRIFSKAPASEMIKVRMDDKISRIKAAQTDEDEDPYWDLMGYLVLHRIAKQREILPTTSHHVLENFKEYRGYLIRPGIKGFVIQNRLGHEWNDGLSKWGPAIEATQFISSKDAEACVDRIISGSFH